MRVRAQLGDQRARDQAEPAVREGLEAGEVRDGGQGVKGQEGSSGGRLDLLTTLTQGA